ncbi:Oligouridylate-binding protein 1B, partial [Mucuna pruriens]
MDPLASGFNSLTKRIHCLASFRGYCPIEPIPSGNLPPGFDPSTCRSVYVGNIHTQVTEPLLQEVFVGTGPVEGCKLIRKEKSFYGLIHYFDRRSAALAILSLNERHLFGHMLVVKERIREVGSNF